MNLRGMERSSRLTFLVVLVATVTASDKALGILVPNAEAARQWMDRGARFVLIVVDALLGPACRGYLQTVRGGKTQ